MDDVLGPNVRRLRTRRNLSQVALAGAVGIHRSTLIDIEQGRADKLALATVSRLADALGVRTRDLLTPPRRRRTG